MSYGRGGAGKAELVQEGQCRVADRRQDDRRAPLASPTGVFAECHVASVVEGVFNGPVPAATSEQGGRVAFFPRRARDAVFIVGPGYAFHGDLTADPVGLLQAGPVATVGVEQGRGADRSLFAPAVGFGDVDRVPRLAVNESLLSGGKAPIAGRKRP